MQSQQSQNWGSAALFYMPRSLKDSKLILFSLGKKKSSSFSCERKGGGNPKLVLHRISTSSCRFRLMSKGPQPLGSCAQANFWNGTMTPACQCQLRNCFVLGELSICKTLVLLTKKGENKSIFHNLRSQRKSHHAQWWRVWHMANWSILIHSGGSRSAYTSYNNVATLCDLIQETRSLFPGFQ